MAEDSGRAVTSDAYVPCYGGSSRALVQLTLGLTDALGAVANFLRKEILENTEQD